MCSHDTLESLKERWWPSRATPCTTASSFFFFFKLEIHPNLPECVHAQPMSHNSELQVIAASTVCWKTVFQSLTCRCSSCSVLTGSSSHSVNWGNFSSLSFKLATTSHFLYSSLCNLYFEVLLQFSAATLNLFHFCDNETVQFLKTVGRIHSHSLIQYFRVFNSQLIRLQLVWVLIDSGCISSAVCSISKNALASSTTAV